MKPITFTDNTAIAGNPHKYIELPVSVPAILTSWRASLFSFEWLDPDGRLKSPGELKEAQKKQRQRIEDKIRNAEPLEKPVLGIGLMDTVEIGIGRAEFLTLAALGYTRIPVHVPQACEKDFQPFAASLQ